jgi:carboxyl-terminal processing protease
MLIMKKKFMKYNNSNKSIFLPIIIGISVAIGVLLGNYLPGKNSSLPNSSLRFREDKINSILNIIESKYVDSVSKSDLEEAAIPAILQKLDPHSVYIPAKDLARANEPLEGNFDGIGISFNMFTDTILVISTIPGGPSEKIGLMPGDKILYVNDSLVAGKKISDEAIMGLLKGPRGTTVKIKVLRKGHVGLIPFEIVRDKIPIYSVDVAYMVNASTGYIKINAFAVTTFDEFMKGLRDLKAEGMKSLIIDLRNNSGGVMDAATQIADQFLQKGQLIVYTEGRAYPREEIRATGTGEFEDGALVILIDEWSASASEILAGAIQDNDRGTIIGRRSFGKGLVQAPMMFNDGSGLRLTIARYYTPTGRSIQKPYNDGYEKYINDLNDRYARGEEFVQSDSLHFPDSLRFTTPGGKVVYGGGGIMPDKFIPLDTTGTSSYFVKVRNAGLIYRFALKFTDENRPDLLKFTKVEEIENYLDKQAISDQFVRFAESNGIKKDAKGLKISGDIMNVQIKAYIARNILDNKGFYPIWEKIDTTLKYAIEFLKENP